MEARAVGESQPILDPTGVQRPVLQVSRVEPPERVKDVEG
jgi:hypothetical protein